MTKKPVLLGFKPSDEDFAMFVQIIEELKKEDKTGLLNPTNSDVLKLALHNLYKEKCSSIRKKYGIN